MRKFAKATLPVIVVLALLVIGTPTVSRAGGALPAPEIDPTTGMAAVALMAGAVLIIRGRRKK
jgi:hypothetical protein